MFENYSRILTYKIIITVKPCLIPHGQSEAIVGIKLGIKFPKNFKMSYRFFENLLKCFFWPKVGFLSKEKKIILEGDKTGFYGIKFFI